jgi:hypothetical protein
MTSLLLALLLCWGANTEPDLDHYHVDVAELHVIGWVPCPRDECPACICPVYNPFAWRRHVVIEPRLVFNCAGQAGAVCIYRHPVAVDVAGNESAQPMLLWPPPYPGECP